MVLKVDVCIFVGQCGKFWEAEGIPEYGTSLDAGEGKGETEECKN